MIYILTAMQREAESLGIPCFVTGIKAGRLPETTQEDILVNVGYCGAVEIQPGTVVEPDESVSYETGEGRKLATHFDVCHAPASHRRNLWWSPVRSTLPCMTWS